MKLLVSIAALLFAIGSIAPLTAEDHDHDYGATDLYQIDLETGELMLVGEVGDGNVLIGLALDTDSENEGMAVGLTMTGELIWFDVASPETLVHSVEITGVESEDMLIGIDYRPATHDLYAISENSFLYWIDTDTGEATMVGEEAFDPALESPMLGFDFNPTVDLVRIDVSTGQNLRLDPETGLVGVTDDGDQMIDGDIMYAEGDEFEGMDARVVAAGYTSNVDGSESTSLYVLDAENNTLAIQDPPNDGLLNTVVVLDVNVSEATAFDIAPDDSAFVTIPRAADEDSMNGDRDDATPENGN